MQLRASTPAAQAFLPLITNKGALRASKPKDGNAAYVWRMVAFAVSTDPRLQCMPCTADFGVTVPAEWCIEPPAAYVAAEMERCAHPGYFAPDKRPADLEAHVRDTWTRGNGFNRRRHYIKAILDPIVAEIVGSVPTRAQAGTMRWARAYGIAS